MINLIYIFICIFGLVIGSFLNCLIYRFALPSFSLKNLGGLRSRSYFPYCKHTLALEDLIPIFSFLILRGKCRYCQNPISWQYPLVELSTAILFLLTYLSHDRDFSMSLIFYWIFTSFLIIIFVYDLKHYIIPDKIIYPAIAIAFLYRLFTILNLPAPLEAEGFLMGGFGILPSVFFLAIIIFSRGKWMGLGDFKLAFFMGLFLGWPKILVALFLAFLIGAIIGLGLVLSGKKRLQSEVPFGPFLITGTFISLFWGQNIINWYLNFLII